jgi:hypothetical protein
MNKSIEWAMLKREYLAELEKYGGPLTVESGTRLAVGHGRLPELARRIDELERELKLGKYKGV